MDRSFTNAGIALAMLSLLVGCGRPVTDRLQGYVEGEFVYIASPLPGALEKLSVQRGDQVKAGDVLFALESVAEKAVLDEADRRSAQGRATLDDAKKGKRPSEIAALDAQLQQARTALTLAQSSLARQEQINRSGATSVDDLDKARANHNNEVHRVAQLEAEMKTAQLGLRADQVVALEESVKASEAMLTKATWDLAQKRQVAPQAGTVFDTLYREGEWVAAGKPVVVLLPPFNIKVRAFVPEERLATIHQGDSVKVTVYGVPEPVLGKVSFISPKAEYTPPVIYSKESRSKLVFMIEVVFDPAIAVKLHPGQPVDIQPGS